MRSHAHPRVHPRMFGSGDHFGGGGEEGPDVVGSKPPLCSQSSSAVLVRMHLGPDSVATHSALTFYLYLCIPRNVLRRPCIERKKRYGEMLTLGNSITPADISVKLPFRHGDNRSALSNLTFFTSTLGQLRVNFEARQPMELTSPSFPSPPFSKCAAPSPASPMA